jgi:predicted nucleic acid binding AN1-type Zn finger protein
MRTWTLRPKRHLLGTPTKFEFKTRHGVQYRMSEVKKQAPRCTHPSCKKKLGLLGFKCKCEADFCANHRAPEVHDCKYDFQEDQKKNLLKYMSTAIVAQKVEAI